MNTNLHCFQCDAPGGSGRWARWLGLIVVTLAPLVFPSPASAQVYSSNIPPPNGPGHALSFDGTDDYLGAAPPAVPAGNSPYTIEAWIRTTAMNSGTIAGWGNFTHNEANAFRLTPTGLVNYWWDTDLLVATPNLAGAWHHVAATFDGTTRRILVDGVVAGSDTPVGHNAGNTHFTIGAANGIEFFFGQMDEVRIWSVGRTVAQIQANMRRQLFGNETGLIAYYRFDEGSGLAASDATDNPASVASLVNGPVWAASTILPFAPTVGALAANIRTAGNVTLNAGINPNSAATTLYFQWGLTPSYGNTQLYNLGSGTSPVAWSNVLTGLMPGATLYWQLVASNSFGPSFSFGQSIHLPTTNIVMNNNDSGAGSLRQTLQDSGAGDTITFAPNVTGTITLTSGELLLAQNVALLGPGASLLALSGNNASRVFNVTNGTSTIEGLTLRDGLTQGASSGANGQGGAIYNSATLLVSNCAVIANTSRGAAGVSGTRPGGAGGHGWGGGIYNSGTLSLVGCAFHRNEAYGGGGGRGASGGTAGGNGGSGGQAVGGAVCNDNALTVINCTFSTNKVFGGSGGNGGFGSFIDGGGGNGGNGDGGTIVNRGTCTLVHATVTGGATAGGLGGTGESFLGTPGLARGGGWFAAGTSNVLLNALLAGNTATSGGSNVFGTITSLGHNLIGVTNDSSGWVASDLVGSAPRDPQLGPLADNGGVNLIPTHAPAPSSPAVNAGDDSALGPPYNVTKDQRGVARPSGAHTDIGAVELAPCQSLVINLGNAGFGSLRDAIACAPPGGTVTFAPGLSGTIVLTSGELVIDKNLTLQGPGAALLSVSGNNASRVFNITSGSNMIAGLTIRDGLNQGATSGANGQGGGIFNGATLLLSNCTLFRNAATGANGVTVPSAAGTPGGDGLGGGVFNVGTLRLVNCALTHNRACGAAGGRGANGPISGFAGGRGGRGLGGAVCNDGALTVIDCTFATNQVCGGNGGGGGAGNFDGCDGSGGNAEGAGVFNRGSSQLVNATLVGGLADGGLPGGDGFCAAVVGQALGGGVRSVVNTTYLLNTLVAANTLGAGGAPANGPDVSGAITSQGHNLIGKTNGSSGWVVTDLRGSDPAPIDPRLGPLADNGGPTLTVALRLCSPAINSGDDTVLGTPWNVTNDQRGLVRRSGAHVDVGAYELIAPLNVRVFAAISGVTYTKTWLVNSNTGNNAFTAEAVCEVTPYADLGGAPITLTITYELRDETNGLVSLVSNTVSRTVSPVCGSSTTFTMPIGLVPSAPLDTVNHTYAIVARLAHVETPGGPVLADNTVTGPTTRFLYFSGRLLFGPRALRIAALEQAPVAGMAVLPTYLNVTFPQITVASPAVSEFTFSRAPLSFVQLLPNGDASYVGPAFSLSLPAVPAGVVSNVCFIRTNFVVGPGGLSATPFVVKLPTGFGYNLGDANGPQGRILQSRLANHSVNLDDALRPVLATVPFPVPAGRYYFCEETKPLWIPADSITWFVQEGRFEISPAAPSAGTYYAVRQPEYAALNALNNQVADNDSLYKKSNDRYYDAVTELGASIIVRAGLNREALLSANLAFGNWGMLSHFPYKNAFESFNGFRGTMTISDDLMTGGSLGVQATALDAGRDCTKAGCSSGTNGADSFSFFPTTNSMPFTPDGGLVSDVTLNPANALEWGSVAQNVYAQSTLPAFDAAVYHLPGTFLRGDLTARGADDRPGFILLSGFGKPGDANYVERPHTPEYETNGLANYAGLNFRVGDLGTRARSTIAGRPVPDYPLTARSKYYVRYGGVSGIHEPVPRTFPANLTLYGYNFTFSSFGLAYLDNESQPHLSIANGSVAVPYPSGFTQDFSHMQITCRGDLGPSDLPGNGQSHLLQYWGNRITPLAMDFYGTPDQECKTNDDRKLGLLVETSVPFVPQPMHGVLGFNTNGNLVTPADNKAGLDSRLSLPANLTVRGPGSESYNFTTVGNAYLNNFDGAPAENPNVGGWLNLAGKIDMPFFEDARVHLHVSARSNANSSPIYMMGGWRAGDAANGHRAWTDGNGLHYFNTANNPAAFDINHWGYPKDNNVSLATYRTNTIDDLYHPRAQQTWQSFVDFDYPLDWSSTTRAFKSFRGQTNSLLVLSVGSQVKRMTPKNAEITFGAEYGGLPKISIGGLLTDAVSDAIGVSGTLKQALAHFQSGPQADVLEIGLAALDRALNDRFDDFLNELLSPTVIEPVVNGLASRLYLSASPATPLALASPAPLLTPASADCLMDRSNCVRTFLQAEIGARFDDLVRPAGPVVEVVSNAVEKVDDILNIILHIAGGPNNRSVAQKIITLLVDNQAAQYAGYLLDTAFLNDTIEKSIGPTLDQIADRVRDLQKPLKKVRDEINGGFRQEVQDLIGGYAGKYAQQLTEDIVAWLNQHPPPALPPSLRPQALRPAGVPSSNPEAEAFKTFLRRRMVEQFAASDVSAGLQVAIKQRLQDVNAEIREMLDTVFQQINQAIRDALASPLAELDNGIAPFLGDISDVMGGGQIQGYASINDDGLRKLRLDGKFSMKVPDAMQFRAYLEILALNSEGSSGCKYGGNNITEVKIGALGVPLDWISKGVNMDLHTKFTADKDGARGFAGAIELKGKMKFEVVEISELAATIAFGKDEGYFGARARARLNAYEVAGGLWFGKTCSIMPLQIIDPSVAEVVPLPEPIIGGYAYAEGWLPVNEWIGIPSSCLLTIRAGIGAGIFYFESGNPRVRTFGGKVLLGADAQVLCIGSAHADIRMVGAKSGSVFRMRGQGTFEAEVCAFLCIGFSKTVGLNYEDGSWDVDF